VNIFHGMKSGFEAPLTFIIALSWKIKTLTINSKCLKVNVLKGVWLLCPALVYLTVFNVYVGNQSADIFLS
jgi:hypothetical protein